MAYFPTESRLGVKSFANVDTATAVPFGTIVRGQDTSSGLGAGEFIYLPGVAGTLTGSVVTYDSSGNTFGKTALTPISGNLKAGQPVAVAMGAIGAAAFGWYQIAGVARVRKIAVVVKPGDKIYLSGTTGKITNVSTNPATGRQLQGAIGAGATAASAASVVGVLLNRPSWEGAKV